MGSYVSLDLRQGLKWSSDYLRNNRLDRSADSVYAALILLNERGRTIDELEQQLRDLRETIKAAEDAAYRKGWDDAVRMLEQRPLDTQPADQ